MATIHVALDTGVLSGTVPSRIALKHKPCCSKAQVTGNSWHAHDPLRDGKNKTSNRSNTLYYMLTLVSARCASGAKFKMKAKVLQCLKIQEKHIPEQLVQPAYLTNSFTPHFRKQCCQSL